MKLTLHPQRRDATLVIHKSFDSLRINGHIYDFAQIPEGASLPSSAVPCEFLSGDITRINGVLHITLVLPHGADASESVRFPAPIINPPDGELELPK